MGKRNRLPFHQLQPGHFWKAEFSTEKRFHGYFVDKYCTLSPSQQSKKLFGTKGTPPCGHTWELHTALYALPTRTAPSPSPLSSSHTSRSLKKTKVYHDKVYCVESHADILNIIHLKPNMLFILQVSTSLFYQYYRFSFISSKPEWAKCFKSIFTVNPYSNPGDRQIQETDKCYDGHFTNEGI